MNTSSCCNASKKPITGLLGKHRNIETVITEQCSAENNASKVSVCQQVITLANARKPSRVPVRLCNLTANTILISSKRNICKLKEVKVLKSVDLRSDDTVNVNVSATQAGDHKSEEKTEQKTIKDQYFS